jgi:GGDEF domain-containing protein
VIDLIGLDSISHQNTQQKVEVLKKFSAILNHSIRAEDQVYKCGNNRFYILLANTEGSSISTTIEKVVNRIDHSITASDLLTKLNISCCLGDDHIAMMDKFEALLLPQQQILSSNNIQQLIDSLYTSTCKQQQQVFRRFRDIELLAIAHVA